MADPTNPFDPANFMKMMEDMPFKDMMPKMPQMAPSDMMGLQQRNMEAMQAASQAAAEGYRDLFTKQVEVFQTMMTEAQAQASVTMDPQARQEMMAKAYEQATAHMGELATAAQSANAEAARIVMDRMKASVEELKKMGGQ